jgi:uncharacterized membrane protein YkvA (DUF1232 family)
MELWLQILIGIVASFVLFVALLYAFARCLQRREPYATFNKLGTRQKLRFFRMLIVAPGLPRRVRLLPILLAAYLASPLDIVPDIIPVLGFVDDVAIVLGVLTLIVRWTPRPLIDDLLERAGEAA